MMRVLILSAIFAVAAAAPSGIFTPVVVPAVRAVAVPAAVPTISPGDIQAAAIDAQVQAQDAAQAAADKARELAEQATENINEKVITDATVAQENNLEAFWSAEDKKWQAVDAIKTAEAQVDGAVASNADILAKSALGGVIPYVAAVGPITPIVAPIPPVVYTPFVQSYSTQTLIQGHKIKTEAKTENKEENKEAAVKTAEPEKQAEQTEAEKTEKAESTESPAVKAAENLKEKPALVAQPIIASPFGLTSVYRYDLAVPAVGPVIAQPILKYGAVHGVLPPTFVKSAW